MKGYKIFVWVGILIILVIGGLIWLASQSKDVDTGNVTKLDEKSIILFYGDGCPHCADVERYIDENNIAQKVFFEKLEVWNNEQNVQIMKEATKICKLDETKIGVPFLFAQSKCYIGTPDVKNFFKQRASL